MATAGALRPPRGVMKAEKIVPAEERGAAEIQGPTGPPPRILVVEDESCIRRLNSKVLVRAGYEVDAAEDGADAWDKLQLRSYDLMVTDNHMPKVTGLELLRRVHAARLAVPVIMATATLPREEFTRCPWLEPAVMLLKPYTFEALLAAVQEVLRATAGVRQRAAPPSVWQVQPTTAGLWTC